jgi:hypothetical protein
MKDDKRMTEEEIEDLVKKTMDEVMASIEPKLQAQQAEYLKNRANNKAEKKD